MGKKQKMNNPGRFWTGMGLIGIEIIGVGIYGLTKLNWDWLTANLIKTISLAMPLVLTNILAFMLIWDGSKKE